MRKKTHHHRHRFQFSATSLLFGVVGMLGLTYAGLIAVVMSYAALTVSFSQSVKNDEASVAVLESQYFNRVSSIQTANYTALGYVTPSQTRFVPGKVMTAMR